MSNVNATMLKRKHYIWPVTFICFNILVLVEGERWLEVDNEKEFHLRTGDSTIQNGTRHACEITARSYARWL
jgi:hypothetical protein